MELIIITHIQHISSRLLIQSPADLIQAKKDLDALREAKVPWAFGPWLMADI